ncbi:MAG: hypothetical protein ABII10_03105 [Candidatus Paceibacterota bacterium]
MVEKLANIQGLFGSSANSETSPLIESIENEIRALEKKVSSGKLSRKEISIHQQRILNLKKKLGII